MSAVERIDDHDTLIALPRNVAMPVIAAVSKPRADAQQGSPTIQPRDGSVRGERLRPLLALVPYLGRYRAKTAAALVALTVASLATLGERIVADLRRDVFSHLTSLSPAFFDSASSGELVSRLTADTTQIKAAVVVSISTALRNLMLFAGASTMMVVSSPRLSAVIAVIPLIVLPLVAFVLVVDQGRIVEQGTHAILAAQNGLYARLARLQLRHS